MDLATLLALIALILALGVEFAERGRSILGWSVVLLALMLLEGRLW